MKKKNLDETKLYKKNMKIHKNLFKVYLLSLGIGVIALIIKGYV